MKIGEPDQLVGMPPDGFGRVVVPLAVILAIDPADVDDDRVRDIRLFHCLEDVPGPGPGIMPVVEMKVRMVVDDGGHECALSTGEDHSDPPPGR